MVSLTKRTKYVSENEFSSSESESFDIIDDCYRSRKNPRSARNCKEDRRWLSKNAIMARQNRQKKKLYINNLENEVKQLKMEKANYSKVVENQSLLITDLKKEVKYLKSAIANSADIGHLIKSIHRSTGMSVATSLDDSLLLKNDYVSKQRHYIARKTPHPWEDSCYHSPPMPELDLLPNHPSNIESNGLAEFNESLLESIHMDDLFGLSNNSAVNTTTLGADANPLNVGLHLNEHNYTSTKDDEVGVCLHVSKHRISVEFCSVCSDNAIEAWSD